MKKIILLLGVLIVFVNFKSSDFVIPEIPPALLKNANAVLLDSRQELVIKDKSGYALTYQYSAAILNSYEKGLNVIDIPYTRGVDKIKKVDVAVYDSHGKKVKTYSLKDCQDTAELSFSVADDARSLYLDLPYENYPYYVKVKIEIETHQSMFYPAWVLQDHSNVSVLKGSFKLTTSVPIRYKESNVSDPKITKEGDKTVYDWSVGNLDAVVFEPFNNKIEDYTPVVYLGATEFSYGAYSGKMDTWQDFGDFIESLNKSQNNLNPEMLKKVKDIASQYDKDIDKVKAVYKYLQDNTRYVSVQLGIGGYQPFKTKFVQEKKYGDCKALSFYTKSLLDAVGVKAYYTLISAGDYPSELDEKFTLSRFNHAIVTVPLKQDTIWLECTSQTNPFGFMGTFTSDRKALLIDDNHKSKVIHTKVYSKDDNETISKSSYKFNVDGTVNLNSSWEFKGIEIENKGFSYMARRHEVEQKQWLKTHWNWGTTMDIKELKMTPPSNTEEPVGEMNFQAVLTTLSRAKATRIFFRPCEYDNISEFTLLEDKRKTPIYIRYPQTQSDEILVSVPVNFKLEKSLKDVEISNKYGYYSRKLIQLDNGDVRVIRKFVFEKGVYPPEEYLEFASFVKSVQKFDKESVVFVSKT